jgi:uncharacterized protein YbjQ (UPF0145 family)
MSGGVIQNSGSVEAYFIMSLEFVGVVVEQSHDCRCHEVEEYKEICSESRRRETS